MGFVLKSFSVERCKRVMKRERERERKRKGISLDFAKRCRLSKRLPLGSYGNDYTVVSRPHESMEENVVPRVCFRQAVMQYAKSVFFGHESIFCNNRTSVLCFAHDTESFQFLLAPANLRIEYHIILSVFFFNSSIFIYAKYLNDQ